MNSRRGVTLFEVVIAAAVLSVVLSGILSVFLFNVRWGRKMNSVFVATNLAKNRMERLRPPRFPFSALDLAEEDSVEVDRGGLEEAGGDYLRTTEITNDHAGYDLTLVKVTVDYKIQGEWSGNPIEIYSLYGDGE